MDERLTDEERENLRHIASDGSPVARLLNECDDLMDQNDVLGDLFGEITDLARAAGYPETMATFRAVQALIAERDAERAARARAEAERDELRAQLSAREAK